MNERQHYRRRSKPEPVVAVRIKLDTEGFKYRKWGAERRCKAHDWVVENAGEIYTADVVEQ